MLWVTSHMLHFNSRLLKNELEVQNRKQTQAELCPTFTWLLFLGIGAYKKIKKTLLAPYTYNLYSLPLCYFLKKNHFMHHKVFAFFGS